jgi:DNA-binding transcriptional ArsR family regulator
MSATASPPHDLDVVKALNHPLRQRILAHLDHPTARVQASPVRMAEALDASLGDISYHVKVLRDLGAVELATTRPRRGAVEHFYRLTGKVRCNGKLDWHDLGRLPEPVRSIIRHALEARDELLSDGETGMCERDEDAWLTDLLKVLG